MDIETKANRWTLFLLTAVSIVCLAIIRTAELRREDKRNGIKKETPTKHMIQTSSVTK